MQIKALMRYDYVAIRSAKIKADATKASFLQG
jgi:hypothetical protein